MGIPIRNVLKMTQASLECCFIGKRRPLNVMLAVTDRCTGKCVYCQISKRKSWEMSLVEIQVMLSRAADMGCQRVGIWGGEPLLRQDLGQIIRHAKSLGLFVTVDTNGHLIPKMDDALSLADHLNISLEGDKSAHDALCGKGNFDRVMAGIKHSQGRHRFWTITVLTKSNLDQVDWILQTAARYGFYTTFQVLHHNDSLGKNDGLFPEPDALREVVSKIIEHKKQGAPVASSFKYLHHLMTWPDYKVTRIKQPGDNPPCRAGDLYCNVDVNGKMYPCSLLIDEMDAPNVREVGFKAAFEALQSAPCGQCIAACFTEYNLLYSLDWQTGWNWLRTLRK